MASHSCILAWRLPGTGEPGGLPSMGSHGVGPNRSDLAAAAAAAINIEYIVCNCSSPDVSSKKYHSISFDENQSLISISVSVFFATPWTEALWASLSMGFSRHKYWSGLPCLPPEHLSNPEIKAGCPALQADSSPSVTREALNIYVCICISFLVYIMTIRKDRSDWEKRHEVMTEWNERPFVHSLCFWARCYDIQAKSC